MQSLFRTSFASVVEPFLVSQQDSARTVKVFIELVQRHEQAFYNFVHKVHSKGAGLFDDLMRWIELFLTVIREGIGKRVSLEYLLPHTGQERIDILREVDAVALYHYRIKVAYEAKVRKRFARGAAVNGSTTAEEDDEAAQALVDGVVRDLSFGDLVRGDEEDLAEDSESEEESETDSETSSETDANAAQDSDEGQVVRVKSQPPHLRVPATAHLKEPVSSFDFPPTSRPGGSRPRSLSLRSHQSGDLTKARNIGSHDIPPVPPLPFRGEPVPRTPLTAQPSLHRRKTTNDMRRGQLKYVQAKSHKTPKKQVPNIKPPDLKAIPDLLPLFVEMVSEEVIDRIVADGCFPRRGYYYSRGRFDWVGAGV